MEYVARFAQTSSSFVGQYSIHGAYHHEITMKSPKIKMALGHGHVVLLHRVAASRKVIRSFARRWQAPEVVEGFGQLWRLASEQEKEPDVMTMVMTNL